MAAPQLSGTPVLILREGSSRTRGHEAQHANVTAARIVAEAVKTALGPKGMDKMLVDSFGDVTITSDGKTILNEMDVQHPAAKMMVEVAKTQDDEVGDGTTTAVVVAGELLGKAEELINKNVHPIIIIDGYRKAEEKALEVLKPGGRLVFITPEKYLYVISARNLRKLLAEYDVEEIELLREDVFRGVLAYPVITVVRKRASLTTIVRFRDGTVMEVKLPRDGSPWLARAQIHKFSGVSIVREHVYKLKDIALRISSGVATGRDKVFVVPDRHSSGREASALVRHSTCENCVPAVL